MVEGAGVSLALLKDMRKEIGSFLVLVSLISLINIPVHSPLAQPKTATTKTKSAAAQQGVNLEISTQGNSIAFDKDHLTVSPGQSIRLTFKNSASSGSQMFHSWVLIQPNTEEQVAAAAASAGEEKGYIPEDPHIIAHTRLLKPGESQTITFRAPSSPGKYPYICTFPGHYVSMKGVLEVRG